MEVEWGRALRPFPLVGEVAEARPWSGCGTGVDPSGPLQEGNRGGVEPKRTTVLRAGARGYQYQTRHTITQMSMRSIHPSVIARFVRRHSLSHRHDSTTTQQEAARTVGIVEQAGFDLPPCVAVPALGLDAMWKAGGS